MLKICGRYVLFSAACVALTRHLRKVPERLLASEIFEDFAGRIQAGEARDAIARMCARAAHVQPAYGRAISRPSQQRTHREELVERQLAMEDVASGQTVCRFQIDRRDHLPV